jgi:Tfp pilus assembly PilM family ATPase
MNIYVGLDIGWKDIKVVEITEDFKVTKIVRAEISRPIEGSEDKQYAEKIKELFSKQKLSKENVVISLHGSHILARTYLPPSKNRDDFETWFVASIEDLIPGTPIADVIYDYEFLESGRVLISFARLGAVEDKIKILKESNIIPKAIDGACLALYHAFDNHLWIKESKNFAILDIGVYSSDLLITKEGEPFISTEILFGGKDLKKGKDCHKLYAQDLAINLEKIFHYYNTKEGLNIEGLILVGDYSKIPGLKKNLNQILGVEVQIEDPFQLKKIDLPADFDSKKSNEYTQALGLALKGLSTKMGINLMPSEMKDSYQVWKFDKGACNFFHKNIMIFGIIFVVFLFLLVVTLKINSDIVGEIDGLKAKRNELAYIDTEVNELNEKISKLRRFGTEPFFWSQMLYNLGNAVPEGLYLKSIATESRLVSAGARPQKKTRVVIEGDARNNETVLKFLKNLEKYFKDIAIDKMKEELRCEFVISLII